MRENADLKARRYLVEARVRILEAHEDNRYLTAEVRGDSGRSYVTGYDAGSWTCSCPAVGPRCSHVRAVQLISVMEPRT
jgi:hypothetical protein